MLSASSDAVYAADFRNGSLSKLGKRIYARRCLCGRSEGKGEMRLYLSSMRAFTVESLGSEQSDGRLRLEQKVKFE